ncbi:MAG TPA: alpha/beta hydrolase [Pyrinomonadaceae bacterium]|nr:alpha/beta hydrolase [Pyrinomonadaceae bacterium]
MTTNLKRVSLLFALLLLTASFAVAQNGESKYAKLGANKIHYKSYGKGKDALVLVHCWTCNLELWRDHIPELSKRARVVALDLPGHGLSDKPETTYSMDFFADAIDAVMKDAGVEHAVLVGHSMGTPVVRQFYRKYPQKTLGIVIVDGALRPFGTKEQREQFTAPLRGPNYKEAGAQMFAAMGSTLSDADKERVKTSFLNTPQYVMVSSMDAMYNDALYAPDKINVPVLAILAKSPFWQPDTEQFLRSLAPDLTFQMWEGVSHFLFLERPKEFNAAVIAFLDQKKLLK